jgi:hypothetical protein
MWGLELHTCRETVWVEFHTNEFVNEANLVPNDFTSPG